MKKNRMRIRMTWFLLILMLASGCKTQSTRFVGDSKPDTETSVMPNMEVHFIDVGQADSILIKTDDHAMLVDAGNNEDEDTLISYLQSQNVEELDYIIGTHPHEDHIGAMDTIMSRFKTGQVLLPEKIHSTQAFQDVLTAIESNRLVLLPARSGDTYTLGEAEFQILAPNGDYGDHLNNWSVGIKLTYGSNRFVMCGDAEDNAETDMLESGIKLSADVLKASHHGSETSNTDEFLDAVDPEYAVISCGKDNQYGHPDVSVLEAFKNKGIRIFRTDEQGSIVATSNGTKITWNVDPSTSMNAGVKPADIGDETKSHETEGLQSNESGSVKKDSIDSAVHITESGTKYHNDGCKYLQGSDMEINLEEAASKGLNPCNVCKPDS